MRRAAVAFEVKLMLHNQEQTLPDPTTSKHIPQQRSIQRLIARLDNLGIEDSYSQNRWKHPDS